MLVLLKTYHVSSSQGSYIVDGNSEKMFASCQIPSCTKYKHTFNNSTAERLITVCSFERSHLKQLEYVSMDHIVTHTIF